MIYFVRHGETDYNRQEICAGQRDVPLNATGLAQAQVVAEKLKNVKFAACYCSPLTRAKQTCAAILKYHPELQPVYDDRIKERACGQVEGQPRWKTPFRSWQINEHLAEMKALGIETFPEIFARVSSFYDQLKSDADKNILVVAHGGIGKATHVYFNGMPASADLEKVHFPNAEVVYFQYPLTDKNK